MYLPYQQSYKPTFGKCKLSVYLSTKIIYQQHKEIKKFRLRNGGGCFYRLSIIFAIKKYATNLSNLFAVGRIVLRFR